METMCTYKRKRLVLYNDLPYLPGFAIFILVTYISLNGLDCSALVNELNLRGAEHAKLIVWENTGFREPEHKKHPHSWSIANAEDLVLWMNSNLSRN